MGRLERSLPGENIWQSDIEPTEGGLIYVDPCAPNSTLSNGEIWRCRLCTGWYQGKSNPRQRGFLKSAISPTETWVAEVTV